MSSLHNCQYAAHLAKLHLSFEGPRRSAARATFRRQMMRTPSMSESRLVDGRLEISRRTLLTAAATFAVPAALSGELVNQDATTEARGPQVTSTWPHGARLAVSFSLMFEAGGQPISGAGGVIPDPIQRGSPDLPTNAFFEYGVYEGIPRLLDLFDKHRIKMSSS